MKTYSVREGDFDFTPNDHPWFIKRRHTTCQFQFKLDKSMWYNVYAPDYPKEGKLPYRGWNKLGFGFTQGFKFIPWFFTNTNRTCVVAEFPNDEMYKMNIALYINDKRGKWDAIQLITVDCDVDYVGVLTWNRYKVTLDIKQVGTTSASNQVSMDLPRSNWLPLRGIGAWHGGKYPAIQDRSFTAKSDYR